MMNIAELIETSLFLSAPDHSMQIQASRDVNYSESPISFSSGSISPFCLWKDGTLTCGPFFPFSSRFFCPNVLIDRLHAVFLITREEYEKMKAYDNAEESRQLLVSILPRKGPDSFERF